MIDFKRIKQFKFHLLCKTINTENNKEGEQCFAIELCVEHRPFCMLEAVALFRKLQNDGELISYAQHYRYGTDDVIQIQEILELNQIESGIKGMIASKTIVPESLPIDEILLKTKY